ncbi:hypothetical protein ACJX0J_015199 [Zea mays]
MIEQLIKDHEEEEEKSNGFSFQRKPQPEQKIVRRDNNINPSHGGSLPNVKNVEKESPFSSAIIANIIDSWEALVDPRRVAAVAPVGKDVYLWQISPDWCSTPVNSAWFASGAACADFTVLINMFLFAHLSLINFPANAACSSLQMPTGFLHHHRFFGGLVEREETDMFYVCIYDHLHTFFFTFYWLFTHSS